MASGIARLARTRSGTRFCLTSNEPCYRVRVRTTDEALLMVECVIRSVRDKKQALEAELAHAREDAEICLVQLQQVQLENCYLETLRQPKNLTWLRGQRVLSVRMLCLQGRSLRALLAKEARVALHALNRKT